MKRVRYPLIIAVLLGLLGVGLFVAITRGGIRLPFAGGGGASEGDRCAVGANGELVGTIIEERSDSVTGQIRYRVSERSLYAYFFGVKNPIVHVMGYFVAILRQRIANMRKCGSTVCPA